METLDEAERFFRDLCTLHELGGADPASGPSCRLADGIPYRRIAEETGSSSATITRINQWLRHGAGGYALVLDRLGLGRTSDDALAICRAQQGPPHGADDRSAEAIRHGLLVARQEHRDATYIFI